jgi:hypothetical protein
MIGRDEKCIKNFGLKKGRDHLEDLDLDGRILEWIHLAQDRDQWRVLVTIEHGNGSFVSVKGEEFIDQLSVSFSRRILLVY